MGGTQARKLSLRSTQVLSIQRVLFWFKDASPLNAGSWSFIYLLLLLFLEKKCNWRITVLQRCVDFGSMTQGGDSVAQSCPTLVTPWTAAHQASLSMHFFRQ